MTNIVTTLFDAADAPHLRAQVAELEGELALLRTDYARIQRELGRANADVKFYYDAFVEQQLKIAENAWGLPGGG